MRLSKLLQNQEHLKAVVRGCETIYLGSVNSLSVITVKYVPPNYVVRFGSEALINEIMDRNAFKRWVV